jgi:hypothetical protein
MMSGNSPPSASASLDETTTGGAVCAAIGAATAVSVSIIENAREKRAVTMFVLRQVAVIRSRVIEHLDDRFEDLLRRLSGHDILALVGCEYYRSPPDRFGRIASMRTGA